jgi:hypothetical protein
MEWKEDRTERPWNGREGLESGGGGERACKGRRTEQRLHGIEGGKQGQRGVAQNVYVYKEGVQGGNIE